MAPNYVLPSYLSAFICNCSVDFVNCVKCKGKDKETVVKWITDSGMSRHVTGSFSDFVKYTPLTDQFVQTTDKDTKIPIKGISTVIMTHDIWDPLNEDRSKSQIYIM